MSPQTPAQLCDEAIRLIDQARAKPPPELKAEVDVAERTIASLRDVLIEQQRRQPSDGQATSLSRVNVALSLVVGLEYSLGGIQRSMLDQAREVLQEVRPQLEVSARS
jgi:hypothetical protein